MKLSPLLLATPALCALLGQSAAQAEDIALSFALPAAPQPVAPSAPIAAPQAADSNDEPLAVPATAANPPSTTSNGAMPQGVYGESEAFAGVGQTTAGAEIPPPPLSSPDPAIATEQQTTIEVAAVSVETAALTSSETSAPQLKADLLAKPEAKPDAIALSFDLGPSAAEIAVATAKTAPSDELAKKQAPLPMLFAGGSDSLVARAVGSAEGTRTAEGNRTQAFYGHIDPGNGVWNLGTFSYQHSANTPEEADEQQLARLQNQSRAIQQKALDHGLDLSLEEILNGIDLANQAPLAALGQGSYVDRLAEARKMGMAGDEAIVWARTRAFLDPDTQHWNAPGLGNNVYSISRDQERRMLAIARAMKVYETQKPTDFQKTVALASGLTPEITAQPSPMIPNASANASASLTFDKATPALQPPAKDAQPPDLGIAPGLSNTRASSAPSAALPGINPPIAANPATTDTPSTEAAAPQHSPTRQPASETGEASLAEQPLSFNGFPAGTSAIPGAVPETTMYSPPSSQAPTSAGLPNNPANPPAAGTSTDPSLHSEVSSEQAQTLSVAVQDSSNTSEEPALMTHDSVTHDSVLPTPTQAAQALVNATKALFQVDLGGNP